MKERIDVGRLLERKASNQASNSDASNQVQRVSSRLPKTGKQSLLEAANSKSLHKDLTIELVRNLVEDYLEEEWDQYIPGSLESNRIWIHNYANIEDHPDKFRIYATNDYMKKYGNRFDDIEVYYRASSSRRWIAELRLFLSICFEYDSNTSRSFELALIRNYRNLGPDSKMDSISLELESNEDEIYTVIDIANIERRVFVVPDFAHEDKKFYLCDVYF